MFWEAAGNKISGVTASKYDMLTTNNQVARILPLLRIKHTLRVFMLQPLVGLS